MAAIWRKPRLDAVQPIQLPRDVTHQAQPAAVVVSTQPITNAGRAARITLPIACPTENPWIS